MLIRLLSLASRSRLLKSCMAALLHRIDLASHRLSHGRWMPTRLLLPTVLLITNGSRTGAPRTVPVISDLGADGTFLIIGSNYGRPQHPAWTSNLLLDPRAVIIHARRAVPVTARLLNGTEKTLHHARITALNPLFDTLEANAKRTFRVFLLLPKPVPDDLPAGPSVQNYQPAAPEPAPADPTVWHPGSFPGGTP
ncbi:nitroreductase/quinone reductase family protein [Streptomyces sp. NPDC127068]|uniref:nitroreductase/quinone reductase family protein n=1 Tax=Streptomyces sp. NPDC127068 TaxID=3347127 RepID=UPI003652C45A